MSSTIQRLGVAATAAILGLIVMAPAAQAATQDTKAATTAVAVTAPVVPVISLNDSQVAGYSSTPQHSTPQRPINIKWAATTLNVSKTSCAGHPRNKSAFAIRNWKRNTNPAQNGRAVAVGWEVTCTGEKANYKAFSYRSADGHGKFLSLVIKPGDRLSIGFLQIEGTLHFSVSNLTTNKYISTQQPNSYGLGDRTEFGAFIQNEGIVAFTQVKIGNSETDRGVTNPKTAEMINDDLCTTSGFTKTGPEKGWVTIKPA